MISLYIIITFFLDYFLSNWVTSFNLFYPLLLVSSLSFMYPLLKDKSKYIYLIIILGFIYDLLYYNLPVNLFIFFIISLLTSLFYAKYKPNLINILIMTTITIITYSFLISLVSFKFNVYNLLYKIGNSLLLNLIFIMLSYFLFKSLILSYEKNSKR